MGWLGHQNTTAPGCLDGEDMSHWGKSQDTLEELNLPAGMRAHQDHLRRGGEGERLVERGSLGNCVGYFPCDPSLDKQQKMDARIIEKDYLVANPALFKIPLK